MTSLGDDITLRDLMTLRKGVSLYSKATRKQASKCIASIVFKDGQKILPQEEDPESIPISKYISNDTYLYMNLLRLHANSTTPHQCVKCFTTASNALIINAVERELCHGNWHTFPCQYISYLLCIDCCIKQYSLSCKAINNIVRINFPK